MCPSHHCVMCADQCESAVEGCLVSVAAAVSGRISARIACNRPSYEDCEFASTEETPKVS